VIPDTAIGLNDVDEAPAATFMPVGVEGERPQGLNTPDTIMDLGGEDTTTVVFESAAGEGDDRGTDSGTVSVIRRLAVPNSPSHRTTMQSPWTVPGKERCQWPLRLRTRDPLRPWVSC
jgi:hypothetical protein